MPQPPAGHTTTTLRTCPDCGGILEPAVADARAVAATKRGVARERSAHALAMSDLRLSPSVTQGSSPALASAQQEEHLAALIRLEGTEIELSFTIVAQQL